MRKSAVQEKKTQAQTEKAMIAIEAAAKKQYEADRKAEEAHKIGKLGTWVSDYNVTFMMKCFDYSTQKHISVIFKMHSILFHILYFWRLGTSIIFWILL